MTKDGSQYRRVSSLTGSSTLKFPAVIAAKTRFVGLTRCCFQHAFDGVGMYTEVVQWIGTVAERTLRRVSM